MDAPNLDFTEEEIHRYARHILLDEVGAKGQARLRAARVLIVGAGGLGAPLLLYLAAAGIGHITLVDHDTVDLSNLQRQIAHTTAAVGRPKVESAAATAAALNPLVTIEPYSARLTAANAERLIAAHDIVADGTDNFPARFLIADAAHLARRPLVSAAILRFEGQLAIFPPEGPCYRCLYPAPPPPGEIPSCAEAGILGAVAGVMGTLQATEILKLILGIGQPLVARLLLWDALTPRTRIIALTQDPACPLCGPHSTIADLAAHG